MNSIQTSISVFSKNQLQPMTGQSVWELTQQVKIKDHTQSLGCMPIPQQAPSTLLISIQVNL